MYGNGDQKMSMGAAVGYASTSATERSIGVVEGIDGELSVQLKQIHELTAQAKSIADRLFGTQPEPVREKSTGGNLQSAHVDRLGATVNYIRESVNELRSHLMRFERL